MITRLGTIVESVADVRFVLIVESCNTKKKKSCEILQPSWRIVDGYRERVLPVARFATRKPERSGDDNPDDGEC
jgi:hypothetical protein